MINKFLSDLLTWLDDSHHWQHLLGGAVIGFGADDEFCAIYAGSIVAAALEFKDKQWGGKWDWIDWGCTVAGGLIGQGLQILIIYLMVNYIL